MQVALAGAVAAVLLLGMLGQVFRIRLIRRLRAEETETWRSLGAPGLAPWSSFAFDWSVILGRTRADSNWSRGLRWQMVLFRWSVVVALVVAAILLLLDRFTWV